MGHCHVGSLNWSIPELWKCEKPSVLAWQCVNKEGKAKCSCFQRMAKDSDFSFVEGVYILLLKSFQMGGINMSTSPSKVPKTNPGTIKTSLL